jgi:serine/threonine-protein kinase SRPK3
MTASPFSAKRALTSLGIRPPAMTPVQLVILPSNILIEEELVFDYDSQHFYPVNPGDIFHNKYEMTTKLKCGSCSTI